MKIAGDAKGLRVMEKGRWVNGNNEIGKDQISTSRINVTSTTNTKKLYNYAFPLSTKASSPQGVHVWVSSPVLH
jgi:hypothetical protein